MAKDILAQLEPILSEDPANWAKLSSDIQFRRWQLLLLMEILAELRKADRERVAKE